MLNLTPKNRLWFATLLSLLIAGSAHSADNGVPAASPLFRGDSILEVTLKTDLPQLIRDRSKTYHSATLTISDPMVRGSEIQLKVGTRGMTSLRVCRFPHFRFKFDTSQTRNTLVAGLEKVKVVSHCNNPELGNEHSNEQKEVLLQYMLYRTYALFTDYSIKVRLARFHYVDSTGQVDPFTKYAFFIEPTESVAARHGAHAEDREDLNNQGYSASSLNGDYAGLDAAFEFMVGNGDWRLLSGDSVNTLNAEVISGNGIKLLPMPYDLDRSGMCNDQFAFHTIYSSGATFPIVGDDVATIRNLYMDYFQGHSLYKMAFSRFREKREAIYALYHSMDSIIDPHYRDRTIGHLDRFFAAIGTHDVDAEFDEGTSNDPSYDLSNDPTNDSSSDLSNN